MDKSVQATGKWITLVAVMVGLVMAAQPLLAQPKVKITAIVLNVTHRLGAEGQFAKSKVGTELPANSRVRTGPRSKCELKFPSGTVVRMAPRSDVVITSVTDRKVKLVSGQVLANVVKGTGAQIEGAVATAAVRGTMLLFTGPPAPGGIEELTVWHGQAEFSTPAGSIVLGHQQTAGAGPTGPPTPPLPGLPFSFPTGTPTPWWFGVKPGTNVQSTPGTTVGTEFKQEKTSSGQLEITKKTIDKPTSASLEVVVESASATAATNSSGAAGLMLLAAAPGAFGALDTQPGTAFGRRFYGPRSPLDVFGLVYTGGSFAGARARASGIWGDNLYLELGGQTVTEFGGDWHTTLSEGFGLWRHDWGDLTVGRQYYLQGPVNNSTLGSLFSYTSFDGVLLHCEGADLSADLAWVDSYDRDIVKRGEGIGALGRLGGALLAGQVGVNYFHESGQGTGVSVDIAYPLVPGQLDVYAEFGDDPWGQHLATWGAYFPSLYQTAGLDLFIEHAERNGYDAMWSVTAYQEMRRGWTGVFSGRRIQGDDWEAGVGAFKRFGSLQ